MPRTYNPKTTPINEGRIQKIALDLIKDAKLEREYLLEAHAMFKEMIEENTQDAVAKTQMVNVLKLMQSSHSKTKEAIEVVLRYETLKLKREQGKAISKDVPDDSDLFTYLKSLDNEK